MTFNIDHSRRFNVGHCLECNKYMDGISGPEVSDVPKGAIMVCAYCSNIMEWNGKRLIKPSTKVMKELKNHPDLKKIMLTAKLFQVWKQKKNVHVIVLEPLEPEICEECGRREECRPYGKRKENGVHKWVCFPCAKKDEAELRRAFDERLEGKNPTFPGEGQ